MGMRRIGFTAGALLLALQAASWVQAQDEYSSAPKSKAPAAAEDIAGRPVDLDLTRGVQAPPRDNSKLPATFAEAAKTQPVDAKWGTTSYKPKSRRDLTGI